MADDRARRVALVVTEALGLVHNGGIATATTYLSFALADRGDDVTILYCGHSPTMNAAWAQRYADHGVRIERLERSTPVSRPILADSYHLYHHLRAHHFDVAVIQDWQGIGFFSMLAKRCGLAFEDTTLVHICHGPTPWLAEANKDLSYGLDAVVLERLERGSAEMADVVVSPSRHLLEWMAAHGWALPDRQHVIPYFTELQTRSFTALDELPDRGGDAFDEIVFFGRLEERKGVVTLCRALNIIGPDDLRGLALTFLGRPATFDTEAVVDLLDEDVRDAMSTVDFMTDLDQPEARAYLQGPGRVAVIPSSLDNSPCVVYECMEDRVPFLASRSGGTGELVSDEDAADTLFDPSPRELAALLGRHVIRRSRPSAARPSYSPQRSLDAWNEVLGHQSDAPVSNGDQPLVTVVVPHFDRPQLLLQCLHSLMTQEYPAIEVVVVDDGSVEAASHRVLESLEQETHRFPLRVIRQDNKYLGAARNTGVAAASGEFVTFVDDDDRVDRSFVSTLVSVMLRTGADAVTCAVRSFGLDRSALPILDDDGVWPFVGDLVTLAPIENYLSAAPLMTRPSTIQQLGGYHERHGVGHEDWTLATALVLSGGTLIAIPEPLYSYRIHGTSMVRTGTVHTNMAPVFQLLASHLPPELQSWPQLLRGLHEQLLRSERSVLEAERDLLIESAERKRLHREIELRERRIYLLEHGLRSPQ